MNIQWYNRLVDFGVPEDLAARSSEGLWSFGLRPGDYRNIFQLQNDLQRLNQQTTPQRQTIIAQEGWDPMQWIIDLLTWIGETIYGWIAPYVPDMGLILIGGLSMWMLPSKWKVVGAAPIIFGIWSFYQKLYPPQV